MSTKTLRKRIALVAVSAMGFGLLSSVAANAATAPAAGDWALSATAATDNYGMVSVTGTTAEMYVSGQAKISDAATIDVGGNGDSIKLKIVQGSGILTYTTGTLTAQTAAVAADGQSVTWTASNATNDTGGDSYALFRPTGAGKVVIQYQSTVSGTTSVVDTLTIYAVTSASSSISGVLSVGDSYCARVATATAATSNVDNSTDPIANGGTAYIGLDLKDAFGGDLAVGAMQVSATGTGVVVAYSAATSSTSTQTAVSADAGTSDYVAVSQATANAPADTTVTISYNGTVICSKPLKFTGDVASIKVSATAADGRFLPLSWACRCRRKEGANQ